MSLIDEVGAEVATIFREQWTTRDGTVVPDQEDLTLRNDAVKLTAAVLYADLDGSTGMVDNNEPSFAAEIYKAYLISACRVIRANDGEITAFDGDRVMAVYLGGSKCTNAVKTALQINHVVQKIVNIKLKAQYPSKTYQIEQVVGVDVGNLWVARTGIRGSNDLVWVGRAANYAAKLSSLPPADGRTWITEEVYDYLSDTSDYKTNNGRPVWKEMTWNAMGGKTIYASSWLFRPE